MDGWTWRSREPTRGEDMARVAIMEGGGRQRCVAFGERKERSRADQKRRKIGVSCV